MKAAAAVAAQLQTLTVLAVIPVPQIAAILSQVKIFNNIIYSSGHIHSVGLNWAPLKIVSQILTIVLRYLYIAFLLPVGGTQDGSEL